MSKRTNVHISSMLAFAIFLVLHSSQLTSAKFSDEPRPASRQMLRLQARSSAETGSSGLNCERDGFFIAGFEDAKVVDGFGTEVPVSKAQCTSADIHPTVPLKATSFNCAAVDSNINKNSLVCPDDQFLFGFEDWKGHFVKDKMLPVGPARCCNMALQGRSQRVQVEPCNCSFPKITTGVGTGNQVSCPANQIVSGFPESRYGIAGKPVPTSPVKCCYACLSDRNDDCKNDCSGNGSCLYGMCVCSSEYMGEDCSVPTNSNNWFSFSKITPMMLIVLVTGAGLSLGVVLANIIAIVTWYGTSTEENNQRPNRYESYRGVDLRQRLLDDCDSDSSIDEDCDDDDHDNAESDDCQEDDGMVTSNADLPKMSRGSNGGSSTFQNEMKEKRKLKIERLQQFQSVSSDEFPHDYICPITQELMIDPVIAGDGHSYERKAIKKWFKMSLISPKTGKVLSHPGVTRNYTLRAAILTYVNQHFKEDMSDIPVSLVDANDCNEVVVDGGNEAEAEGNTSSNDDGEASDSNV